ncbi:TPA: hypothetical protein DEP34_03050 [Candidatus Uhrbacteria bacterium]|nr:hypothetical protein [Candidatus Uhrbacteria bacterium]HCB19340.1 hypothetical protein [Candidatus Uhrbacteria bacterium]
MRSGDFFVEKEKAFSKEKAAWLETSEGAMGKRTKKLSGRKAHGRKGRNRGTRTKMVRRGTRGWEEILSPQLSLGEEGVKPSVR